MKLDIQALRELYESFKTAMPDDATNIQIKVWAGIPALLDRLEFMEKAMVQAVKSGGLDSQYALNHTSEPTPELAAWLREKATAEVEGA